MVIKFITNLINMAELIGIIQGKPDWQEKLNKPEIVENWRQEIVSQGISVKVFDCILELLKSYKKTTENEYEDEDDFDWAMPLGVSLEKDIGFKCDCECLSCTEGHNAGDDEEDEDEDEEEDDKDESAWSKDWKRRKKLACICTDEMRITRHQKFVDKFALRKTFDDASLKAALVAQIANLEKSFTSVDYHPGSNNQVIDLVHPSLFCFVKGVSQIQNVGSEPAPTTDAVFQWLPSEFKVYRSADNSVERVSVDSYINNLPRETNEGLYDSIGQVFGKLVPQFDELLETLHTTERLKSPSAAYVPLSQCQVIVKLANIVIAPGENARFPGGHWHLEGMATERIVATGIYYYDMTNVAPNSLQFRCVIDDPCEVPYPQNGTDAVELHFGMNAMDDDHQYETTVDLGEVATVEDMQLVFPNFLQHKVSDFTLLDPKQQGTRKILCFFLINPYEQVVSTAHVAPQQSGAAGMTLEEAQMYRELLMFQRKYEIDDQTHFFERGWSLCEH